MGADVHDDYIENLRSFDSHERPILLAWATGSPLTVSEAAREQIGAAIGLTVPKDAFVAMDYLFDWLYAAIELTAHSIEREAIRDWPADDSLKANIEDVDLLVAWVDEAGRAHTVLLEAKGYTGWTNKQMLSKAKRLGSIFSADERLTEFDPHFVLVGPTESKGLEIDSWPDFMRKGGRVHFLPLADPGDRFAVQRCLEDGTPNKPPSGQTSSHWKIIRRLWKKGAP